MLKIDPPRGEALSLGSKGSNVRTVQVRLAVHGYATAADGDWGPVTDGKVRTFQTIQGLAVDGVVNVPGQTWDALGQKPLHPTVRPGYQGGFVAVLQRALNALAGAGLEVDGKYSVAQHQPDADRHSGVPAGQRAGGGRRVRAAHVGRRRPGGGGQGLRRGVIECPLGGAGGGEAVAGVSSRRSAAAGRTSTDCRAKRAGAGRSQRGRRARLRKKRRPLTSRRGGRSPPGSRRGRSALRPGPSSPSRR